MNRAFILCIAFFTLVFLWGCKGKTGSVDYGDVITLTVHERSAAETIDLAEIVDSVKYIPLETTRESLIGFMIHKVFITVNQMFVMTGGLVPDRILCFDNNGKYLRNISRKGRGPGEYTEIIKVLLDEGYYQSSQRQFPVLQTRLWTELPTSGGSVGDRFGGKVQALGYSIRNNTSGKVFGLQFLFPSAER